MAQHEGFSDRIRRLREGRSLTQDELGKEIGLSQTSVNQIETGVTKAPRRRTMQKLAEFFGVTEEYLQHGRNLTPFVAGGELNKQGGTVLQPGTKERLLPLANMTEIDVEHRPATEPTAAPTNAKEFIAGLLKEIDSLKHQLSLSREETAKVYRVLEESQRSNRVCQEQLSLLLGKSSGNQYAPGVTTMQLLLDEPAQAEPAEDTCTIYPMFTTPAPHRRMHRVVAQAS